MLALASSVFSGVVPVILKRPTQRHPPLVVNGIKLFFGFVATTVVMALIRPNWLWHIGPRAWLFGFLGALLGPVLAWFFYLGAIRDMDVSLASPGVNSFPLLAIFVDFLVYSVVPSPLALMGGAVILAGLWLLSFDSPSTKQTKRAWVFVSLTAICWGVNSVIFKALAHQAPLMVATWLRVGFAFAMMAGVVLIFHRKELLRLGAKDTAAVALAGLSHDFAGMFLFLAALKLSQIYVVSPLNSTSPLFAALLSGRFLQEKISPSRWAGVILVVLGVAVISLVR